MLIRYQEVEKLGWISSKGSLDVVIELLRGISRDDIVQKLQCDKGHQDILPSVIFKVNKPIQTNEPVDRRLMDLVANEISNDWKRLGRFLDISESKLEEIDSDNHKLYEKSVQMLNEWTRCYSIATSARLNVLNNALSEIPRYDIIRHIDSNCKINNKQIKPDESSLQPLITQQSSMTEYSSILDQQIKKLHMYNGNEEDEIEIVNFPNLNEASDLNSSNLNEVEIFCSIEDEDSHIFKYRDVDD